MTIRKVFDVNFGLLKDYQEILKLNPGNWDISSYLNLKYDINSAIAFSKLFFPDFIEIKGCIIIGFRYDELVFEQWFEKLNGDTQKVEAVCNRYDIMDYFSNNSLDDHTIESNNILIDHLAEILKKSWEVNCKILFPEKNIIISVYEEYDTTRITLFSK